MIKLPIDDANAIAKLMKDISAVVDIDQVVAILEISGWGFITPLIGHFPSPHKVTTRSILGTATFATIGKQAPVFLNGQGEVIIQNELVRIDIGSV